MRDNLLIDASYYNDVQDLTDDEQGKLYKALIDYGFERKEPENLSGSLLVIFKVLARRIEGAQAKYDAAKQNGKLGGRPKKSKNENQTKTSGKTSEKTSSINQWENQTKTERKTKTEFSFPSDNKIKNIFYLSTTENARPKEYASELRQEYMTDYYDYHKGTVWADVYLEIIDTLLEFREYAKLKGKIKYKSTEYTAEQIEEILATRGKTIAEELPAKLLNYSTIHNRAMYIVGVLLDNQKY